MSLSPREIQAVAAQMLSDYDAHRPHAIFVERGTDWLTLDDACAVQRAVAALRRARGERCLGYKVGCISPVIQKQFGLHQPVWGYVWESEAHVSGCHLACHSFANLAIEGEIALRLRHSIRPDVASDEDLAARVEGWFPVIELHHYVFRGATPTGQELVAGNAMHAGFVAPSSLRSAGVAGLAHADLRVEVNGDLVETNNTAALPGGPLGSLRWLALSLASTEERLEAGDIVLTGSPGRLIPVSAGCAVAVACAGQRVELFTD